MGRPNVQGGQDAGCFHLCRRLLVAARRRAPYAAGGGGGGFGGLGGGGLGGFGGIGSDGLKVHTENACSRGVKPRKISN